VARPSKQDVMAEIERQFRGSDRTTALKTVNLLIGAPGEREQLQLDVLGTAGGSLEQLKSQVAETKRTSRGLRPSAAATATAPPPSMAAARLSQAAAIAQLQGAQHVAGEDASAPVGSSKEYPPYRVLFYVAIGVIPVLTLGGAIPVGIAAGGISACRKIATDARQPHLNRILFCLGITVACWVGLFALVGGIALLHR
jgi:hypothetical protein